MNRIIKIKNNKSTVDIWIGYELQPDEYLLLDDESLKERAKQDDKVFIDIGTGDLLVNQGQDTTDDITNPLDGWNWLTSNLSVDVHSVGEVIVEWGQLKAFFDSNDGSVLNYVEFSSYYYVWIYYQGHNIYMPQLLKSNSEGIDFEANYKAKANIGKAVETRITNCRYGLLAHNRYISLTTSDQDNFDNTDWRDVDYGDVTYTMKDVEGNTTLDNDLCKETWLDVEFPYLAYDVVGGKVYIPSVLGGDENLWELHVIAAPDVPAAYGGDIHFIANPRLKWAKGTWVSEDSSLNPAELGYDSVYHSGTIRFIFKHPVAAQTEFQTHLKIFK